MRSLQKITQPEFIVNPILMRRVSASGTRAMAERLKSMAEWSMRMDFYANVASKNSDGGESLVLGEKNES